MELTETIRRCAACPGLKDRMNAVVGEGPVPCRYVLLGEAPGADEDATGRPFVGASGKLLRGALKRADLIPGTYHILNVLKCRPPENRDPTQEEIANCRTFLKLQLAAIKPKAILALGRYAQAYFTGEAPQKLKVTENAGRVATWNGIKVVLTFHPAYIQRNRNTPIEEAFRGHLKQFKQLGETNEPHT